MKATTITEIRPVNTTYEPFSKEPEYIEANERFIAEADLQGVNRFLDMACGTGLISGLLLGANRKARLNGIDYDPVQIDLATDHLAALGHPVQRGFALTDEQVDGKPVVMLGVCSADDVPCADGSFDCITICNAIHMLPDKERLLNEVRRLLKPGGIFGFNTSFYAGTYAEGTEGHFVHWVSEADRFIKQLNEQRVAEGKQKVKRVRGQSHGAFQNKWFSETEWIQMLEAADLHVTRRNERVVMLDERCLKAIAAYGGFAEVLLSGYPVDISSEALQSTVERSLELAGMQALPRNYLEIWATRK